MTLALHEDDLAATTTIARTTGRTGCRVLWSVRLGPEARHGFGVSATSSHRGISVNAEIAESLLRFAEDAGTASSELKGRSQSGFRKSPRCATI